MRFHLSLGEGHMNKLVSTNKGSIPVLVYYEVLKNSDWQLILFGDIEYIDDYLIFTCLCVGGTSI